MIFAGESNQHRLRSIFPTTTNDPSMGDVEQARTLFFEALDFLDASDFQAAEARLRQALRLSPDNPAIFTNLSVALLQQGNRADAHEFAAKAVVADPRNVEALLVLADCHTHAGDLTAALDDYDRITALQPGIAEAHNNRGLVLHRLAHPAEALASCDRALALSPSLSGAHVSSATPRHSPRSTARSR
jgi:tetratricopeptide (TPR) repeat protein